MQIKIISAEKKELEKLNHEAKIEIEQAKDDRARAIAERERSKKVSICYIQFHTYKHMLNELSLADGRSCAKGS